MYSIVDHLGSTNRTNHVDVEVRVGCEGSSQAHIYPCHKAVRIIQQGFTNKGHQGKSTCSASHDVIKDLRARRSMSNIVKLNGRLPPNLNNGLCYGIAAKLCLWWMIFSGGGGGGVWNLYYDEDYCPKDHTAL